MTLPIFHVDAFTGVLFHGNPACVVPLAKWLPRDQMQRIAAENGVPETAFFIDCGDHYELKWFTPDVEMDLCGHATLATAHVLVRHLGREPSPTMIFRTKAGELKVSAGAGGYTLDLPARPAIPALLPVEITGAFGYEPLEVLKARDYVLIFASEEEVRDLQPDRTILDRINLDPGGIICTARGNEVDFVSRYFTPQATIFEDPVTGSSHCTLAPLWGERLRKKVMTARQLSHRGGALFCTLAEDRVLIKGQAVTFMEGKFTV